MSAAVLGSEDSKRTVRRRRQQDQRAARVWIEVRNRTSQPLWLLQSGTDPDYFSPLEVAWSMHTLLGGATNASIDDHFNKLGFRNPILPVKPARDCVHQPDRDPKLVNIDLFGNRTLVPSPLSCTSRMTFPTLAWR